jgi:hypothetical protein
MTDGEITWLLGRDGGIGFLRSGVNLLMLTGQPGDIESNSFELHPGAVRSMHELLGRFQSTGSLHNAAACPSVAWGMGEPPSL